MLGRVDSQGGFERKWAWCGMALAHLKLVQAPEYDAAAQARVRGYLAQCFVALRGPYDRPPSGGPSSQLNNHMTWAGLAAMAANSERRDRSGISISPGQQIQGTVSAHPGSRQGGAARRLQDGCA